MNDTGAKDTAADGAAEAASVAGARRPFSGVAGRMAASISRVRPEFWIILFYVLFTLYLTWPLITRFSSSIYGVPGDNLGTIWLNWWYKNAGAYGGSVTFCPLIGAPFGSSLGFPVQPLGYLEWRFLLLFTNEVVAWNIDVLLGYALSGVTMYYLVRHLLHDRRVAFFAGIAFMLSAFHVNYSMFIGSGLAATQWMPLYILCLILFIEKPGWKTALGVSLSAILVANTSLHFGLFMGVFTPAFLIGRWVYLVVRDASGGGLRRSIRDHLSVNRRTALLSLCALLVFVIAVLPFFVLYASDYNPPGRWPTSPTPAELRIDEYLYGASASPAQYLRPNFKNSLLAPLQRRLHKVTQALYVDSVYIGWTVFLLATICLVLTLSKWRSRKRKLREARDEHRAPHGGGGAAPAMWGFAAAGLSAFVFSLKPGFSIGSAEIPLPSRIMTLIAPWFRWYNRWSVVVGLCLIVIAAAGLVLLAHRFRPRSIIVVTLFVALLLVEMVPVPPFKNFDFSDTPGVFSAVDKMKGDPVLVFYPIHENGPFLASQLLFYQRVFKKPMLNGATANSDGEAARRTVYNPYDPATPSYLKRLGMTHAVVFVGEIEENAGWPLDPSRLPEGFREVARFNEDGPFGQARIYEVKGRPADILPLYLGNISVPIMAREGETMRVLDGLGTIRLENYTGEDRVITLKVPLRNPYSRGKVTISAKSGEELATGLMDQGQEAMVEIGNLRVPSGGLELNITKSGPATRLSNNELAIFAMRNALLQIDNVEIVER